MTRTRTPKELEDLELLKKFIAEEIGNPGPYLTTEEVEDTYKIVDFCFAIPSVIRKSDGQPGYMRFADAQACLGEGHYGRLYFGFRPK